MIKKALILILVVLAISGCSKSAQGVVTPTATVPAAITPQGVFPTLPAATAVSSASPTPFIPFTVKPTVDNLKVHVSPGTLFDALILVHQTDTLTVVGTVPGNEWTYIKTKDGTEGWVFSQLLQSSVDLKQIPLLEPKDVQLIKGRVTDASGAPIRGVTFALGEASQADISSNTATTDANGEFYAYIPSTASGTWTVTYTSIACDSPVWSDTACTTYKAGYTGGVDPQTVSVVVPQVNPLTFTWK